MTKSRNILLASDFSARCDRPLDRAIMLSREWNARLVIGHVVEQAPHAAKVRGLDEIRVSLGLQLPEAAREAELVVKPGSTPQVLADLAKADGSDIIVVGVARYNSWGDYVLGTAVDYIVRHAEVPVLVVRQRPLKSYRRLLVATDFSDCSRHALVSAGQLFPDIPIRLIHAWHVPFEGFLKSEDTRRDVRETEMEEMTKFVANKLIDPEIRARISTIVEEGELGPVIGQHLSPPDGDLLVLGTHGQSGFVHAMIGSRASELLSSVSNDVLMVRDRRH